MLETSKDNPIMADRHEVKVNPFNTEKGLSIKTSFDLGKLAWAMVVVTTEPASPETEAAVLSALEQVARTKNPGLLNKQLHSIVKVSLCCVDVV